MGAGAWTSACRWSFAACRCRRVSASRCSSTRKERASMASLKAAPSPSVRERVGVRVNVRELPLSGALALRLDPRNAAAIESAGRVFGAALPGPNAWLACETVQVLSQAYDEWLILTP